MSQNLTGSPYSVFGPGEIQFMGNAPALARGRTTQAIRSHNTINALNPASYSALTLTGIEAGLIQTNGTVKSASVSQSSANAGFGYLNVGIPVSVKRGAGISFGLMPYSVVGYRVTSVIDTLLYTYDTLNNPVYMKGVNQTLYGKGGLTKFYIGGGMNVMKLKSTTVSLGVNAGYVFGKLSNLSQIYFPPQYYRFNTEENKSTYAGGFIFDFGIQAEQKIGNYFACLGATITTQSPLAAKLEYTYRTLPYGAASSGIRDTISYSQQTNGTMVLPTTLRTGISFYDKKHFLLAMDYDRTQWADYRNFGNSDALQNAWKFSVGGSYTPNPTDGKTIFSRMEYRAGFRHEQGNVVFQGHGITENAFSAGVGIPMQKSFSRLNISVEYLTRGSIDYQMVQENYVRIVLGVSFSDKWFIRAKYD